MTLTLCVGAGCQACGPGHVGETATAVAELARHGAGAAAASCFASMTDRIVWLAITCVFSESSEESRRHFVRYSEQTFARVPDFTMVTV
jgi:hypothetical protein